MEEQKRQFFHEFDEEVDHFYLFRLPEFKSPQFDFKSLQQSEEVEGKREYDKKRGNGKKKKGAKKPKARRYRKKSESDFEMNSGHWTKQENQKYHRFLEIHTSEFFKKDERRTKKIFKLMATHLETRMPEQCRSHHQKMQKKYHSFGQILKILRLDFFGSCDPIHVQKDLKNNGIVWTGQLLKQSDLEQNGREVQDLVDISLNNSRFEDEPSFFYSFQKGVKQPHLLGEEYEKTLPSINFL